MTQTRQKSQKFAVQETKHDSAIYFIVSSQNEKTGWGKFRKRSDIDIGELFFNICLNK